MCSNESYVQKAVYFYFYKIFTAFNSWRWCQMLFDFYQILNSFNKLKMMSEVVLLTNTEFLQQVEDDVRGCSATKYWIPSTTWRWCQRLFYYQILNSFNKLKMMSEVVWLPNTEFLQQVEDDVTQFSKQYTTPCQVWILLQS